MNKTADKLRKLADGLTSYIEDKRRPMTQNSTPKRNREYRSRLHDGNNWERAQQALRLLADAHEAGTVPPLLSKVTTKADVFPLVHKGLVGAGYYDVIPSLDYSNKTPEGRALQTMLEAKPETATEKANREQRERQSKINELEERLRFSDAPGFFPTPKPLADELVRRANIKPGQSVLEPSAGKGDLADAVKTFEPTAQIVTVERLHAARDVLIAKGYTVAGEDFLVYNNGGFDRIVMNPPFERGQDIDHVRHAFNQLKPGGKLVALMSEGVFNRSDRKSTEFQAWLEAVGGVSEPSQDGAFKGVQAFRQTGTASRIVEIHS